jgi:hypothetical protein
MRFIEKALTGIALGSLPPLAGFIAGWWGAYAFLPERSIPPAALSGFIAGLLVDLVFLGRWVSRAYTFRWRVWIAVYIFYTVGLFGFFMGVPVFNLALVIPAGCFIGARLARQGAGWEQVRRTAHKACLFTTGVLAVVCALSAVLAWFDPYTGANLEGMFHLPFEVSRAMLAGLIGGGGVTLLLLGWGLTAQAVRLAYRLTRAAGDLPEAAVAARSNSA